MEDNKDDPLIRDNKIHKGSSFTSTIQFLLTLVGIPLCILILPFSILSMTLMKLRKPHHQILEPPKLDGPPPVVIPLVDREYDLVLFGATGFTGKLAAEYLAKNYVGKIRWAIAGRNREALEAVRKNLCNFHESLKDLPLLVCDSSKFDTLRPVVNSTRVIVSTVGPFTVYGTPLVAQCAISGTSYCDITGETEWVRKIIFQYNGILRKSGARVICMAGCDCVPWDISTLAVANKLKETNENLTEITFYDEFIGTPSGGTLETITHNLDHPEKSTYPFDPLLQMQDGSLSHHHVTPRNPKFPSFKGGRWVGHSLMSSINANCVKRSNAIFRFSKNLVFREYRVYEGFVNVFVNFFGFLFFFTGMTCLPVRWLMTRFLLPKPGSGPSKSAMDKGFLKVTGIGIGDKGTKIKSMIYFPNDPGYKDTARMVVETGLALAFDTEKLKFGGGIWTPACLGEVLLERLVATGCTFTIQSF